MKRRFAWLIGAGMSSLLLEGCLFQQTTLRPPKQPESVVSSEQSTSGPGAVTDPIDAVPTPPAPPLSDYHPRDQVARPAGYYVEPSSPPPPEEIKPVSMESSASTNTMLPPTKPTPEAPLVAALKCAIEKHPEEANQLLAKYQKHDRELLIALVRLTADLGEGDMQKLSPEEVTRTLEQLASVSRGLRQKAPLKLEKVCFCDKIQGFGRYSVCAVGHEFQAGSEEHPGERVQVYAEVLNFISKPNQGMFETILESRLEIHDAKRNQIAEIDLGRCVDRSQTPRQDYFLNFQLHVPPKLPPGLYTLWLKVKDVTTDPPRETRCSLDFKVRAAGDTP